MKEISVLVADALRLHAEGLALALHWSPELAVAEHYPTTAQEVLDVVGETKPDVLLLDFWLPDMAGPAVVAEALKRSLHTKVLVLSWVYSRDQIGAVLRAGAVGFLPKSVTVGQAVDAIRRAAEGENPVLGDKLGAMVGAMDERSQRVEAIRESLSVLTPRELELLRHLSFGHSTVEISKDLSIAQATVRDHFHNIVTKTGARTKEQALALAKYCGLIKD